MQFIETRKYILPPNAIRGREESDKCLFFIHWMMVRPLVSNFLSHAEILDAHFPFTYFVLLSVSVGGKCINLIAFEMHLNNCFPERMDGIVSPCPGFV